MCGIAGIASLAGDAEVLRNAIGRMTRSLRHRGPDDTGEVVVNEGEAVVALGHTRLAILDLSEAGRQPMTAGESKAWIVFNGEIYNYRELASALSLSGVSFQGCSDTEVLLKAHCLWGDRVFAMLRGIFALAIWQPGRVAGEARLVLARDHLGVKPLYWVRLGGGLAFASEVRALLESGEVSRTLDREGVASYLAYGSVQEPLTLVEGVSSLRPGSILTWRPKGIQEESFWNLQDLPKQAKPLPIAEVRRALEDAVRSQLVSDVPLGVFLSGGIDSTAIASLAAQDGGGVRTFAVVMPGTEHDERGYSRIAARRIGSDHTEIELDPGDVRRSVSVAVEAFDQPSMDGVNTWIVSRAVREAGIKVALSGVGGDELFGGYGGFRRALLLDRLWKASALFREGTGPMAAALRKLSGRSEIARKLQDLAAERECPYFVSRRLFSDGQIRSLLPAASERMSSWREKCLIGLAASARALDPINRVSFLEMQTYMRSTLLRDTDQMSMAHGLEVRVPLLDQRLVELIFPSPGVQKVHPREPKVLLTTALRDLLPTECVYRRKRGFTLPFDRWLHAELGESVELVLRDPEASRRAGLFEESGDHTWRQFRAGAVSWSRPWALFVLLSWLRRTGVSA